MTPPQRPTRPEGYQVIPTNPEGVMLTPSPVLVEPPSGRSPSASVTMAVAVVLGIVLSTAAIVAGLGRAFYVERTEYTQKILRDAERDVDVRRALEQVNVALAKQEATMSRIAESLENTRDSLRSLQVGQPPRAKAQTSRATTAALGPR